jgi:hypothetical protein
VSSLLYNPRCLGREQRDERCADLRDSQPEQLLTKRAGQLAPLVRLELGGGLVVRKRARTIFNRRAGSPNGTHHDDNNGIESLAANLGSYIVRRNSWF